MTEQKVFCVKCKKDLSDFENMDQCECGSKDFIFGNTVVETEKGFACKCGAEYSQRIGHISMDTKHITTYKCLGCGARFSIEIHYNSLYM